MTYRNDEVESRDKLFPYNEIKIRVTSNTEDFDDDDDDGWLGDWVLVGMKKLMLRVKFNLEAPVRPNLYLVYIVALFKYY